MLFLSGKVSVQLDRSMPPECGWMYQPDVSNVRPPGRLWAADNGCFAAGNNFNADRWLGWLASRDRTGCLFAVAPDVVADAAATLVRSTPYLPILRDLGYKPAYVAQDSWDPSVVPWDDFDCLFIGGTTAFKLGRAEELTKLGHAHGKWVHVGRVNSARRIAAMEAYGVDSVDGTFLVFGPDKNVKRLQGWFDAMKRQPSLF